MNVPQVTDGILTTSSNDAGTNMTDIITLVCTLPTQYQKHPHKSPKQIARLLKLKQRRGEVDPRKISAYLTENPHLLDEWLRWSEDKRWSPAWYLSKSAANWVLAYYPDGPEHVYKDPIQACTKFVEAELDDIVSRL